MFPIDIVVTEVNDLDPKWFELFNKCKKLEIGNGSNYTSATDDQAFGDERFRDWHTLKYWFRGVDVCCPWVNKVFLIVQSEKQVPNWLDRDNPKLRIVCHNEYIPKELLPTFNARTIMTFIPCIEDLSEHYLCFDNDCFCMNPFTYDKFFTKDGKPRCTNSTLDEKVKSYADILGNWGYSLESTYEIEKKYGAGDSRYTIDHLLKPQLKSVGKEILEENYIEIYDRLKTSRFRRKENVIPTFLITNVMKRLGICEFGNGGFNNCRYVSILGDTDFYAYKDFQVVCFNDVGGNYDFDDVRSRLLEFFEKQFPNKSKFEK